jgi:hypothetical protein
MKTNLPVKILRVSIVILVLLFSAVFNVDATTYYTSSTGGDWNSSSSWSTSCGSAASSGIPGSGDDVYICSGQTVTIGEIGDACHSITIESGGTLEFTGTFTLTVNGNWENDGTFTANTGTINFNGITSISGSVDTYFNNVTISGTLTAPSGIMYVAGDWINNGTFNNSSKTVTFDATSGSHSISGKLPASNDFYNLTFNTGSSGTATWTFASDAAVGGDFTITNGTVTAPSGNLYVAGNWINNGIFYPGPGTVIFNGISTISGSSTNSFYNVTISGSLTAPSGNMYVTGPYWNNNGTFNAGMTGIVTFNGSGASHTQTIDGTAATTFNDLSVGGSSAVILNAPPSTVTVCNNDLTIASGGSVTLNYGQALTVSGTLTNNSGTSGLVIYDGGSLIYDQGAPPADPYIPTGTIQRLVTAGTPGNGTSGPTGYHFMSSPVEQTTFGDVFPSNWTLIWAQSYGESTSTWTNWYHYDNMTPRTGYSIWVSPSAGTSQTANFSGTFNTEVQQTVTYTSTSSNPGWNLLGNPYTSAVDWEYENNSTHWYSPLDATVYIWNGSQYATWTYAGSGYGAMANSDIPAQSGFFVHLSSPYTSATITVPWAARVHYNHYLYKEAVPNLLHLGITGNNYRDDTYICFITGATAGFDSQYDAYKLWGISAAPQLYSIIPGANLAGNALPSIESNPEVSIGLKVGAETTYTITADGMESFDASVPIHLDDLKLGVSTDLRENPAYSFTAAPGDSASRFRIRFNSPAGIDEQKAVNIFIYTANEQIVLNNEDNFEGTYYVYNTTGQLIATLQMLPGKEYVNSLPAGMYIVKAVTGGTTITRKVVLL